jgi:WNK lysine deficient protein kinase
LIQINQTLSGCFKNAEFPFDVDRDTSLSVALEMVDDFELPQGNIQIVAQLIEAFLLILIPEWVPCVAVGQVVSESADNYITKRIMNCRQLRSVAPDNSASPKLSVI